MASKHSSFPHSRPGVRAQYLRPWPASPQAPWILPDDLAVTPEEVAEYGAFCYGQPLPSEQISEAQCWQFLARKNEFFLDDTIPDTEKRDRTRTLTAWHPIGCRAVSAP